MPQTTKEIQQRQAELKAIIAKGEAAEIELEASREAVLFEQDKALVNHSRVIGNLAHNIVCIEDELKKQIARELASFSAKLERMETNIEVIEYRLRRHKHKAKPSTTTSRRRK